MGVRFPSVSFTGNNGSVPATGAETVVQTTPALTLPLDGAVVIIIWRLVVVIGTGTTTINNRIRRGTTVSAVQVDTDNAVNVTAGNVVVVSGMTVDTPGAADKVQYSLTMQGVGTTGAFTSGAGAMIAFAL